ncbi:hypothetical protein Hypma_010986 [Hypsizygus marmoreus]|uniref:Uncharacterized protein n=1 Tax=Hypsizygus marmoreus TaxID=39966 RepID=A0A369JIP7_HYPMA|nr:hypothetical protein Hypma_010986 [Hypsizygus marmoreus]
MSSELNPQEHISAPFPPNWELCDNTTPFRYHAIQAGHPGLRLADQDQQNILTAVRLHNSGARGSLVICLFTPAHDPAAVPTPVIHLAIRELGDARKMPNTHCPVHVYVGGYSGWW